MRYRPTLQESLEPVFVFVTRALRTFGLFALIAIILLVAQDNLARAESAPCYAGEGERVTLRGTIVQSTTLEANDGTGEPAHTKFTAVALEKAVCFSGFSAPEYVLRICSNISQKKWLGHRVIVIGTLYIDEDLCFTVEQIKDAPQESANSAPPAPASPDPDKVDDSKLAEVSCHWVLRPDRGTDDSITEHAVDHLEAFRDSGKLPEKYFWSACTMYEYVLAECRANPRASLLDVVNSLIAKVKAGKEMPDMPRPCGA